MVARSLAVLALLIEALACQPPCVDGEPTEGESEATPPANDPAALLLSARGDAIAAPPGGAWLDTFADFDALECAMEWHGPAGIDSHEVDIEKIATTSFGTLWRVPEAASAGDVFTGIVSCSAPVNAPATLNHFVVAGAPPVRAAPRVRSQSVRATTPYQAHICDGPNSDNPRDVSIPTAIVDVSVDSEAPALLVDAHVVADGRSGPVAVPQPTAYDVDAGHVRVPFGGNTHFTGSLRLVDLALGASSDPVDVDVSIADASCAHAAGGATPATALVFALFARRRRRLAH